MILVFQIPIFNQMTLAASQTDFKVLTEKDIKKMAAEEQYIHFKL